MKTPQQERALTLVAPTGVEILNRQQVAERLGIPPESIYALTRNRANDPIPVHYAGRELKFVWGEVFDWFLHRKRKPRTLKNRIAGKAKTKKQAAA